MSVGTVSIDRDGITAGLDSIKIATAVSAEGHGDSAGGGGGAGDVDVVGDGVVDDLDVEVLVCGVANIAGGGVAVGTFCGGGGVGGGEDGGGDEGGEEGKKAQGEIAVAIWAVPEEMVIAYIMWGEFWFVCAHWWFCLLSLFLFLRWRHA